MSTEQFNAAFDREEQRTRDRDYEQWLDDTFDPLTEDIGEQGAHEQQFKWRQRKGLEPI